MNITHIFICLACIIALLYGSSLVTVVCILIGYLLYLKLTPKRNKPVKYTRNIKMRRYTPQPPRPIENFDNVYGLGPSQEEILLYWRQLTIADPNGILLRHKLARRRSRRWRTYFRGVDIMPTIYEVDEEVQEDEYFDLPGAPIFQGNLTERYLNKTFHIDTYESQTLSNFCMTSTAELMAQSERAKRLRELIIDKKPSVIMAKLSKNIMSIGGHILKRLNKIQQRAVLLALTIKDYLLIKGMPGTGKTATVVALIQLLVQLKKTVLITSHTHSAVDNVCLRLLDCGVDVLRLGSEHRVHPRLKCRTEGALTSNCKTVDELKQVYNTAQVVAVTCLAAAHPIFTYRSLDVCIVDESTQVLQCSLIKTLLSTSSFILIGDPDQLPPVVKNPEAMRRGMSESLFERLDNPSSTVTLTLQYRMNKVITALANAVTYHGHLLCADDSIGFAVLDLPQIEVS